MNMRIINVSCDHVSSVPISPGGTASVARLTQEPEVPGSIIGPATHTFVSPLANPRRSVFSFWQKYEHLVMVNRLGGLSLSTNSMVRLTDHPVMTVAVYRGH